MTKTINKAIVIGATGLVGRTLVHALHQLEQCQSITAVVRHSVTEFENLAKVQQLILEDFLLLNDEDVNGHSHAFSCLGTTLKKAGSKQNFYDIDFEINAHFADLLQDKPIHYILVSALGANPKSWVFYNHVKGELEDYIQSLNLAQVSILRPSLLLGVHSEPRILEQTAQLAYAKLSNFLPQTFKYKPVTAEQVAHTMVEVAQSQTEAFQIYDNLSIQQYSLNGEKK